MTTSTSMIVEGFYTKSTIQGEWGREHGVPRTCGKPVLSRPGQPPCVCVPSWFQKGVWTCGLHRADKNMPRTNALPPPPPETVTPKFVPFECAICMEDCDEESNATTTPCNHRFHKKCMWKWKSVRRTSRIVPCPLCRGTVSRQRIVDVPIQMQPTLHEPAHTLPEYVQQRNMFIAAILERAEDGTIEWDMAYNIINRWVNLRE